MPCKADSCDRSGRVDGKTGQRYFLKGYCSLHYQRLYRHGDPLAIRVMKHGMYASPTYSSWNNMIQRCTNPKYTYYEYYGGRGITVCNRWLDFRNFLEDMGNKPEGLTLDRVDVDGNYELSNCRWATRKEQAQNRRNNKLKLIGV